MAYKNISLAVEVYEDLARAKKPGESFSQEIRRLLGERPSLTEVFGIFSDKEADEMHRAVKELRKEKVREWRY